MDKQKLVLVGGGGHCRAVLAQIKQLGKFEVVGVIDERDSIGLDLPVLGRDRDLDRIYDSGVHLALVTVGSTGDNANRQRLCRLVTEKGFSLPVIVSATAKVDETVTIGAGTVIMAGSIVNVNTVIGINSIVNSGAIIEHDCRIGDHCHIAPGACLSGGVQVGDLGFIGAGSTIIQNIKVGKEATIGAGSVVIEDVPDNSVVAGNPARIIRYKF
ncbi:sugar O-acyltransferase, sialic acid O-acetyltransferase NeuD family [Thermincola ferriacetica]|uniref:Sugar O-acyltransferase, sialic acid O-acetyltransferase NeuD family n=1 Tax=Thermincola ferriacetica TaxID=281456 RepID=A0A0L6W414_9FIRM|nr:acetyltransferase [Thermincola ferriacetica]KNZ70113.1 sugar O-acyltransferase, sialic acid O-acetyltransferase NeuD family [Thermincola ferriacetica]